MQRLGTERKKSYNLSGQKSHSTSRDKKNHATSWDKKSHNLLILKKNHTTSWDKKCPKSSNLSHKQNPGDRHRSPWSCYFHTLGTMGTIKLDEIYLILSFMNQKFLQPWPVFLPPDQVTVMYVQVWIRLRSPPFEFLNCVEFRPTGFIRECLILTGLPCLVLIVSICLHHLAYYFTLSVLNSQETTTTLYPTCLFTRLESQAWSQQGS